MMTQTSPPELMSGLMLESRELEFEFSSLAAGGRNARQSCSGPRYGCIQGWNRSENA
jgi:hypothetical protein